MEASARHFQLITAVGSEADAGRLATLLVEQRLAACVQVVGPVTSTYWWEGRVQTEAEWLCLVKTTAAALEPAMEAIRAEHSYDEPEITATPIVAGSPGYLGWIDQEVRPAHG
ncbi:MAG: divalent-cation tolerance protein CutA [Actinobacteria bacterium]|nr:divalent-cation tolerance protein CutA [Actinomycetota bacterium]MBW3650586.1 divalent-cation tolerance protein CutA [Actinomycetota bacterium]